MSITGDRQVAGNAYLKLAESQDDPMINSCLDRNSVTVEQLRKKLIFRDRKTKQKFTKQTRMAAP